MKNKTSRECKFRYVLNFDIYHFRLWYAFQAKYVSVGMLVHGANDAAYGDCTSPYSKVFS